MPSVTDYSKILKKLELVISNANYGQKLLTLTTESSLNIFLDRGVTQYIHIFPKGMPTPLQVKIFKNYGKFVTYISKKITEPSEEIYDDKIFGNIIEITDSGSTFKVPRVALGITALKETHVYVSMKYGALYNKLKSSESDKYFGLYRGNNVLVQEDSLDLKLKEEKLKHKLEWRRKLPAYLSLQKSKTIRDTTKEKVRRELNYTRSKKIFESIISKKKNLKTSEINERKLKIHYGYQRKITSVFFSLLTLIKVSGFLRVLFIKRKKTLTPVISEVEQKIISFQQRYRQWTKGLSTNTTLERARINLLFYRGNILSVSKEESTRKIVKCFKTVVLFLKLWHNTDRLRIKGNEYIVKYIQRKWKKYRLLKNHRLDKLERTWLRLVRKENKKDKLDISKKYLSLDISYVRSIIEKYYFQFLKVYSADTYHLVFMPFDALYSGSKLFAFVMNYIKYSS